MVADLRCRECGRTYAAAAGEPWRCECGHPLDYVERSLPDRESPPAPSALERGSGLWSFQEFIPESPLVTLGEGRTPLVDADDWDAQFKLEYLFPTGSFKDRGATTTLSRAAALGVEKVVEDSSGNAGAAIATYAARAGIEADVYVPDDVKQSKLVAIQRAGARPVRIEGDREAVAAACREAADDEGVWYASHAWNPAFYAGTATFAYEVAAQRDWTAPDAVVLPLGHGTLFLGAYRGFRALREAGYVDRIPRLLAGQAAGYAPIAAELHADDADDEPGNRLTTALDSAEDAPTNEIADGIQIAEPVREAQLFDAIADAGGDAIAISGDAVEGELDRLHRAGFYVEPTSAVATAALREYRRRDVLAPGDDVVVPLTGSGMKTL
ncbi:threonine synthase [Natronoarchaeum philippinense]|uniref:Threonine synthase n=1 Tax=Natronoarchaeum philippinense TaxID=558529 RepID=A0A285P7Z8_NATPI|nr:pyridoxal-phosphate dependent enzyme [Natronoarchaeum philippinense]SNZ17832.1 threonine synthase [Natronoarchaeum philippinense]